MFIVCQTEFEYNDEIHYASEGNSGKPVGVFANKSDAEKFARKLTIEQFLRGWGGENLGGFGYNVKDIFASMPACSKIDEDQFFELGYEGFDAAFSIGSLSDDELGEVADCLNITPYFVEEAPFFGPNAV